MRRFFTARGRLNRGKFFLYNVLISIIANIGTMIVSYSDNLLVVLLAAVLSIALAVASIMITIQRLHDINRPGIHFLLLLVPLYNIYLGFVLLLKKGTDGPNQYGEDPLRK